MGLTRVNICRDMPKLDMESKEWKEEGDKLWNILQEHGSVCITDLSKSGTWDIIEELKKDPNVLAEYNGNIPFDEFYTKVMNGDYDEK